jgi:hypothetical protein
MVLRARAAPDAVRGKSVRVAAIGVRPCSASPATRSAKTRQSRTTCSRRHSGKMPVVMVVEAEAAPAVVRPAREAHAAVRAKVILAAVAVMPVGKVSRAAAIVPPGLTTRRVALSRIR